MTVTLMPDVERMLSSYLRAQPDMTGLIGQRVYTSVPADPVFPLLRLVRIGGLPLISNLLWVDRALVQFDAWGGPKAQAWGVAETARALVAELNYADGSLPEGVVGNVTLGEFRYQPDTEYTPARPRYLFTATLTVHPVAVGS